MAEVYVAPFTGNFAASYREMNKLPCIMWDNFANRTNITASSSDPNYSILNVVEENTVDFWRPVGLVPSWIRVSGLTSRVIDCVAIRGHNLWDIAATVTVNAGGTVVATYAPKSNGVLIIAFPEVRGAGDVTININTNGWALVGSVMVGRRLVMPNGLDGSSFRPIEFSTVTDLMSNRTQTGQLLGNRVVRRGVSADIPINAVDEAFVYGRFKGFISHYNAGRPFVFASSPTLAPNDAGWFWRPGSSPDLEVTSISRGYYAEFSIPAEGVYL